MAKQGPQNKLEYSIKGLVTFYKLHNKWYFRAYSSLTGERVKTSEEFINSMICADRFGAASQLASVVYQTLPSGWQQVKLYRKFLAIGVKCFNTAPEMTWREIIQAMEQQLKDWGYNSRTRYEIIPPSSLKLTVKQFREAGKHAAKLTKTPMQRFVKILNPADCAKELHPPPLPPLFLIPLSFRSSCIGCQR